MILVTGSTGTVGSETVRQLVAAGQRVRALVHSPEKVDKAIALGAEPMVGDFLEPSSLTSAFAGVEGVFHLAPMHPRETEMGLNALQAAEKAGVKRFVYLSVVRADLGTGIPHFETKARVEEALQRSAIPSTILRPHFFMQNLAGFRGAIQKGELAQPMGEHRYSLVDVRDIAAMAVACLTQEGHERKAYLAVGPQALTFHQVAETFARHLGRPVRYVPLPVQEWAQRARSAGWPDWLIHDLGVMWGYNQDHDIAESPEDARRVLRREPRSLDAFVRELVAKW